MDDKHFLHLALKEGQKGQSPHLFGAVLVRKGEVIATGYNRVWENNDPSAHAEVSAIVAACNKLSTHNLPPGCTLYCSSEPCVMCFMCAVWAKVERIVYSTPASEASATYGFKKTTLQDINSQLQSPILLEQML
jgi:guanine deaminase